MDTTTLRNRCNNRIDMAMMEYNTFQERFAKDPADAMIWSQSLFHAAARIDVYKAIVKHIDQECEIEEIIEMLARKINQQVREATSFSTNQTSNLFESYRLRILSEARELLIDWAYA